MMDSESILLIGMVVGLFGSLMMLAGDLLQHLSTEKLEINTASQAYCIVMRELPESHDDFFDTHFSSTLCTVAALPYAAAFATLPLAANSTPGFILLFIAAILSKVGIGVLFSNPKKSFSTFSRAVVIPAYAGVLLLAVSILFGATCFPQWMVAITPLVTITLGFVWQYLPLKIGKPLTEYWNNLVFILMFGIMAAWLFSMLI